MEEEQTVNGIKSKNGLYHVSVAAPMQPPYPSISSKPLQRSGFRSPGETSKASTKSQLRLRQVPAIVVKARLCRSEHGWRRQLPTNRSAQPFCLTLRFCAAYNRITSHETPRATGIWPRFCSAGLLFGRPLTAAGWLRRMSPNRMRAKLSADIDLWAGKKRS